MKGLQGKGKNKGINSQRDEKVEMLSKPVQRIGKLSTPFERHNHHLVAKSLCVCIRVAFPTSLEAILFFVVVLRLASVTCS